jgi:hypothetical protein
MLGRHDGEFEGELGRRDGEFEGGELGYNEGFNVSPGFDGAVVGKRVFW